MTTLVKLHRKGQLTLPRGFRVAMGVDEGSLIELSLKNGKAIMSPQLTINRDIVTGKPKNRKALLNELAAAVAELRQDAKEKGIDKMSKREINAAVAWARRDLKNTSKRAGK
jgi:bifunctional DNA-binding transcriptional regulator/antitoxin component of YhaV-PrlF toxin-antitoxin module